MKLQMFVPMLYLNTLTETSFSMAAVAEGAEEEEARM